MIGFLKGLRELALIFVSDCGSDFRDGGVGVKKEIGSLFHAMLLCVRCNGISEFFAEDGFNRCRIDAEMPGERLDCDVLVQVGIQVLVDFFRKR